jgi:hypothetical protein
MRRLPWRLVDRTCCDRWTAVEESHLKKEVWQSVET